MCYLCVCNNRYGLGCLEQALFPPLIWTLWGLENMRTGSFNSGAKIQKYFKYTTKVGFCLIDIHDLAFDTTGDLGAGEGLDVGGLEAGDALRGLEE